MMKIKKFASFMLFLAMLVCTVSTATFASAEGENLLTESDCVVTNAILNVDNEMTYTEGDNSIKLNLLKAESSIRLTLPAIQQFDAFEDVIVNFRMYVKGQSGYSTLRLYKSGGDIIDYGFPVSVWNNVRFKTKVFEENGTKFIHVALNNASGAVVWISNVNVVTAPEEGPLLGGVTLYQMEAKSQLMESYVLETADGSIVVMDGGDTADAETLVKFIRTFKNEVDHWFLSHYHSDHVNAIIRVINFFDIKIKNLYFDFPTGKEIQQMCGDADYVCSDNLTAAIANHSEKIENVIVPQRGDEIKVDDCTVKVLNNAYKGAGNNYGNDTSVVYKFETPGEDILFLGDLGAYGDEYLKDTEYFVPEAETCTIIQLAHHGQRGTTDKFYEMIKEKKVCLYAAKQWIYDNDGGGGFNTANLDTLHTRNLVREWGVLSIYTQADGRVRII